MMKRNQRLKTLNMGYHMALFWDPFSWQYTCYFFRDIISKHMFQCHIYTDDIQLYIAFNLGDNSKSAKVNANIDKCSTIINDIFFYFRDFEYPSLLFSYYCRRLTYLHINIITCIIFIVCL